MASNSQFSTSYLTRLRETVLNDIVSAKCMADGRLKTLTIASKRAYNTGEIVVNLDLPGDIGNVVQAVMLYDADDGIIWQENEAFNRADNHSLNYQIYIRVYQIQKNLEGRGKYDASQTSL